jgi:hypothetical protein
LRDQQAIKWIVVMSRLGVQRAQMGKTDREHPEIFVTEHGFEVEREMAFSEARRIARSTDLESGDRRSFGKSHVAPRRAAARLGLVPRGGRRD